ncbi:uncharacterized protein LOC111862038 isoform X2 [Cryptotermes secundus]|uniref:uncharacterized protein LOC111862038 isoform X2 n=1 Tax=Cryptotermes secundus TaxID=105785 RepID=UPI000CD7C19B|nr:uncharacterized protein LOC111862038 isoform X2 [Cryptotermes secundus]
MKELLVLIIVVMTSAHLLQESVANSHYENCSKKMRQLILDSCAEPKDKRNAILAENKDLFTRHRPAQQSASPSLLGKVLGVPSCWTEDLAIFDDSNIQHRRNLPAVHNLIVECCVDGCTPSQILGLCN